MERIKDGWLDFVDFVGKPMIYFMAFILAGFIFSLTMVFVTNDDRKTYFVCQISDQGTPESCRTVSKIQYGE